MINQEIVQAIASINSDFDAIDSMDSISVEKFREVLRLLKSQQRDKQLIYVVVKAKIGFEEINTKIESFNRRIKHIQDYIAQASSFNPSKFWSKNSFIQNFCLELASVQQQEPMFQLLPGYPSRSIQSQAGSHSVCFASRPALMWQISFSNLKCNPI